MGSGHGQGTRARRRLQPPFHEARGARAARRAAAVRGAAALRAAVLAAFAALLAGCGEQRAPQLYFSNWEGEIGPDTLTGFEARTGIHVVVEPITDNVSLQTKLLTGRSGSDVVVPGSNFVQPLIAAGALQKLDKSRLPNWRNLDPGILALLERVDPGNEFGVPYVWGTQAFAYDERAVRKALGREPEASWRLLFDPDDARRLAACGIAWQDSAGSIMVDLALLAIGRDPAAESLEDLRAAEAALARVRPYVRYIDSGDRFRSDLATGEICIATGSSGELLQAAELARDSGAPVDIRYVLPREGALLWVDLLVVPASAPHPAAAHAFLNYLLEPEVIARVTNAAKFANAVPASLPLIDEAVRLNTGVYPPMEVRSRLHLVPAESHEYARARTRMWARLRSLSPAPES